MQCGSRRYLGWIIASVLSLALCGGALAKASDHPPLTTLTIFVTDYSTHKPVFQAHLTLTFLDPNSHFHKWISYSAKTDLNGRYKFLFIPMGLTVLYVTDPNHQSYGRKFQITKFNEVVHVALRKPQPLR